MIGRSELSLLCGQSLELGAPANGRVAKQSDGMVHGVGIKNPSCMLNTVLSLPPPGNPPLANPYGDANLTTPVMPVQQLVAEILFVRTSYVKKIIEDCSNSEETVKLLRFSCWENPQFSSTVLSELLWQVRDQPCRRGSQPVTLFTV